MICVEEVPQCKKCAETLTVIFIVSCPPLTDPDNGTFTCLLGDDGVLSYKDTCSFACNTGYELTGSGNRTCQSDGSWSGSLSLCSGKVLV